MTGRLRRILERLGWFYGGALAIGMAMPAAFGRLAEEVGEKELDGVNRSVLLALRAHEAPPLDGLALALTTLGSPTGIALLGLVFAAWLATKRRLLDAVALATTLVGASLLTFSLKHAFGFVRPSLWHQLVTETTPSFPSGHTVGSFALFGFVAVWLVLDDPRKAWRWLLAAICLAVAALVGLSRLYLGVHWPTDVAAGVIVAAFWLTVCFVGREWFARRERARRPTTNETL